MKEQSEEQSELEAAPDQVMASTTPHPVQEVSTHRQPAVIITDPPTLITDEMLKFAKDLSAPIPLEVLEVALDALAKNYYLPNRYDRTLMVVIDPSRPDFGRKLDLLEEALDGGELYWRTFRESDEPSG